MNAETFCEHFATFADAPNGIVKLRELIFQLAVQGKLVPQDMGDEPASSLLTRVAVERHRRSDLGKLKSPTSMPPVECESLPNGWETVRLGSVIELISGQHLTAAEYNEDGQGHPYLTGPADFGDKHPVAKRWTNAGRALARLNDILITVKGAGIGKTNTVATETVFISRQLMAVRPIVVDHEFIHLVLRSAYDQFQRQGVGIAIPGISREDVLFFKIWLPPLAEQRRIVEKVDQLLGLCDELAARQAAQREKRQRLVGATLDRLVSTRNPAEFPTHAHRLRNNFDQLFDTPTTIPQLRRAILQLAVQGQLVQQDPKDEPASETVRRVELERRVMIADGKLREEKLLLPTVDPATAPMPLGWANVRLGYVINCLDHIRRPVNKEERETKRGKYPYYGANGQVGWIDDFLFDEDLVLVVEDESFIGRVKPFSYKITGKTWVNNHAHVLQPTFAVDVDFLNFALSFYPFTPLTSGTTNRKKLTKVGLMNAPIQLPPVAEQKRIACKVTELLSLCDALEAKLTQANSASTQLLSAAVHHLLNGAATNV
jgi:type I restriction enzyme S subunit